MAAIHSNASALDFGSANNAANAGNIFSLANAQARRRSVSAESTTVINDCRDIAVKRITEVLSKTFDSIEDELFEMAQLAADRDTQALYLDARAQSREKRCAIETSFRKQFLSFFAKKVAGPNDEEAKPAGGFDFSNLSLVEDSDLEEKIAVDEIARRLANNCDDELRALSQRMGFLMHEPELEDDANPMSPDTIIKALQIACEQMTSGYKTKLTVMRMVEQHMAKEMMSVYQDINSHLVARQIMPTIRPTFRKAQNGNPRKPGAASPSPADAGQYAASAGAQGMTFGADRAAGGVDQLGQDLFSTLQQLMSGGAAFAPQGDNASFAGSASNPNASSGSFAAMAPAGPQEALQQFARASGTWAAAEAGVASAGLVSALTQIQQQVMANTAQFAAMANMQHFVPGETSVSSLNVLREVKEKSFNASAENGQQGNQVDGMTIDIVAMLFDYVFEDKAIPDTIKALLARLQIPVLKVAILDKSFFSKKAHPARRLLDVLAEASVCFAGQATREDPLYQKIELLVDRIHTEFETDITIFAMALAEFEEFMAQREAASANMIEQSARVVHEGEKREMARLIAIDEMERCTHAYQLPAAVIAMLRGPWVRVLERVYLRDGGRNQNFMDALEGADDLAWSVAPKLDGDERKRLVGMLPKLLKRLQLGMDIAAVEQEDRQRFFSALVDCHAAAVKAGLRGESVTSLLASTQPAAEAAPLFEKLMAEERAREVAMKSANRSGVARIQFTDHGVEIEEIVSQKSINSNALNELQVANKVAPQVSNQGPNAAVATKNLNPDATGKTAGNASAVDFDIGDEVDSADSASTNDFSDAPPLELKRGTWVEFMHDGSAKVRAKLTWISPLKGVLLFTNPGATEALSIAPETLQSQLRAGIARIIEESSLVDRAVNRIVSSLSAQAA